MKYGEWVIKYRWLVVIASLVVLGLSGYGLKFLGFEADNRVFFSPENPQLKALEQLEETYNKEDSVLFVIAAPDGDIFTGETLGAIQKLTEASWQIPYSVRVNSITNYQHTWVDGDDLIVEDLVKDPASMTEATLEDTKKIATGEPMLLGRLISGSGDVTAVSVTLVLPDKNEEVIPQVARFAREMAKDFRIANPALELYLSGGVIYDDAFASAGRDDLATLIPIMLVVMILIIFVTLRTISGTVATVIVILSAAIAAMGLTGWYGIRISVPVSMAPVIVITLAIADSIHILTTVGREMRSGAPKREAIVESLRLNLAPVFLTSITTAIGFLSMNFSDAPPFNDLGNVVATGVGAAFFFSIFLLPALMAILPMRRGKEKKQTKADFMTMVGEFVIRRRNPLFAGMSIFLVILSFGYSRLEFDDNFLKYFDKSFEIRRAGDFIEERLTGLNAIEYSLPSGVEFGINDPGYLTRVDEFAAWWRFKPEVSNVSTITDVIKRLNRNMHGDDESYYRIPAERALAAQYLLLYEMSLPYGLDLNNQIDVTKSATRMIVTLKDVTSKRMRSLEAEGNQWLKANAPENFSYATGVSLMFAHISERNINGMLWGTTIALIIISGVLIIALKSLKLGLISLVPNLIPAFMTFGLWGLIEGRVGLAVAVISAISLGIVVDDTVHLLSKYLRARREGMGPEDSVRYAFRTVGRAIFSTSIILVAGFLVLTWSGFRVNSSMGLLTAIAISFAFIADVFFLPPLLIAVDQDKKGEI